MYILNEVLLELASVYELCNKDDLILLFIIPVHYALYNIWMF